MRTWSLFVVLTVVLIASGACVGYGYAQSRKLVQRNYSGQELIISGVDPQGNPLLIQAQISRAQIPLTGKFTHYYDIHLTYRDTNESVYRDEVRSTDEIAPLGALTAYEHLAHPDLSARESFRFTVSVGKTTALVEITGLEGDFLIKNTREYTKYISVGAARVTIGNVSFDADASAEVAYSTDFAPLVFFPGHETLTSETHVITAWDDRHNFYMVDISSVPQPTPAYMPHTWVLMKTASTGARYRAFSASTHFTGGRDGAVDWQVSVPELDHLAFSIHDAVRSNARPGEGMLTGTVTRDSDSPHTLHGVFLHHLHGEAK